MAAASNSLDRLYPLLLRDAWNSLPDRVRRFHSGNGVMQATGRFRVRHSPHRIARFCAWLARLPAPGGDVVIHLTVVRAEGIAEHWRRSFGGRPLLSYQCARSDGILVEHWGLLELRFQLDVKDGALLYFPRGSALRLGPFRLPLPGLISPAITASERAGEGDTDISIHVEASMPLVGLLMMYEGAIACAEVSA